MHSHTIVRRSALWTFLSLAALACGGGDDAPPTGPPTGPPDPPDGTGEPATIEVTPDTASLHALGDSTQLAAVVRDVGGDEVADATITWANADTAVATVSAAGWIVAKGNGTVAIVASSGELADTAAVEVAQVAGAVEVSPAADTLAQGDTLRLSVAVADSNGFPIAESPTAVWASANDAVVSVDSTGLATAVRGGGAAVVTASVDGVEGAADLTVLDRIAFVVGVGAGTDIYIINADGSGLEKLAGSDSADFTPAWSPDGTRIAFTSLRDGNPEVYVMSADGGKAVNLTDHPGSDTGPVWSPDGERLAFMSYRDGNQEIYVVDADGGGIVRLTNNTAFDRAPAWSPDGSQIVFSGADNDLFLISAQGGGVTNLINGAIDSFTPAWYPDGSRILFWAYPDKIYTVAPDGSDLMPLVESSGTDYRPTLSPDGTKLAFVSDRDGNEEIYVMSSDGSGPATNVTNNAAIDDYPAWSPDGARLLFISSRNGATEFHVMNADGTGVVRITFDLVHQTEPGWRPRP